MVDEKNRNNGWGELIYQYTRANAIEDGVLIDVDSKLLKEAGIVIPLAITRSVWVRCVEVPEGLEDQDMTGRLWDILCCLRATIQFKRPNNDTILFQVYVKNKADKGPKPVQLKAVIGPGDDPKPVFTVMLPEED